MIYVIDKWFNDCWDFILFEENSSNCNKRFDFVDVEGFLENVVKDVN